MSNLDALCILEAALLCADEPLSINNLQLLFDSQLDKNELQVLIQQLQDQWEHKGLELIEVRSGWRFQSRSNMLNYLERLKVERAPRYSRATLEVLSIIAYRQPVTRGDIEEIRGVMVSTQVIRLLEERGWVEVVGHRETPGRPGLYATTKRFLDDLGLISLTELPMLDGEAILGESVALLDESNVSWFGDQTQEQPVDNNLFPEVTQGKDTFVTKRNARVQKEVEENNE